MAKRETAEEIDVVAAAWAARMDDGVLSEAHREQLDAWLAGDSRRLGAFARARAVAVNSRRAAGLASELHAEPVPEALPSRRTLLAASVAGLGVAGAGLIAARWRQSQTLETGRGEIRTQALQDGSELVLSTMSRVSIRYGQSTRQVMLMFGEVLFDIADDPSRPFVIHSAGAVLTAHSGRFLLRRLDQTTLRVSAIAGEARLLSRSQDEHLIRASQEISLLPEAEGRVEAIDASHTARMLAWTDGNIAFHNDTLATAASEFGRFRGAPILIADPEVASMKITGLFVANDPAAFARAVAISLDLRAEISSNRIVLSLG